MRAAAEQRAAPTRQPCRGAHRSAATYFYPLAAASKLPRAQDGQSACAFVHTRANHCTSLPCFPSCSNFQDAEGKKREKAERLRFGRFFYRFPNGESGADVYDRCALLPFSFLPERRVLGLACIGL